VAPPDRLPPLARLPQFASPDVSRAFLDLRVLEHLGLLAGALPSPTSSSLPLEEGLLAVPSRLLLRVLDRALTSRVPRSSVFFSFPGKWRVTLQDGAGVLPGSGSRVV